ncbi:MAG: hypothetical protein ACREDI_15060 [Roseiarcus sp.]
MQKRVRKYIRFDFAQALHTRVTSAERHDYRIIARARASDVSLTKRSHAALHSVATPHAFAREPSAPQPA